MDNKNKRKILLTIALILMVLGIGSTLAYFTSTSSFDNLFNATSCKAKTNEVFTSPENWKPGDETPKTVTVTSDCSSCMNTRVSYEEKWLDKNGNELPLKVNNDSVAIINFDNEDDWEQFGKYYYYKHNLNSGNTSSSFIKSITYNPDIDYERNCTTENNIEKCTTTSPYEDATYTLTIKVETVECSAKDEAWQEDSNWTLYNQIEFQTQSRALGRKYTGPHADAYDKSGTENIYYYKVEGYNNVRLGNYCWQILRTTDTGGVKLIYNGRYNATSKCNNSGTAQQIGTSQFNTNNDLPAYTGYMYNPDILITNKANSAPTSGSLTGNNVTYSNGTYTLTNTSTRLGSRYHYTCNNTTGTCATVRYYYYNNMYVELTNGRKIENALSDMLTANNINTTNSSIKSYIDRWYANNMTSYSKYFEDTVFCNDRTQENASSNGWNNNGSLTTQMRFITNPNGLLCTSEINRFSTLNDNARLTYKVGLPSYPEMLLLTDDLRKTGRFYWLGSPAVFTNISQLRAISDTGSTSGIGNANTNLGVRPSVSLVPGIQYSEGTGTVTDPYVIVMD